MILELIQVHIFHEASSIYTTGHQDWQAGSPEITVGIMSILVVSIQFFRSSSQLARALKIIQT